MRSDRVLNHVPAWLRTATRRVGVGIVLLSLVATARVIVILVGQVPTDQFITAQVAYLEDSIDDGAGRHMQDLFPEGRFFTHVLTGLAGLSHDTPNADDVAAAREHLEVLFEEGPRFGSGMTPDHGIFHAGWTLQLALDIAVVSPLPEDHELVRRLAVQVDDAFHADGPFLQSYPGRRWPVDNVVAAAALARAGRVFDEPEWVRTVSEWRVSALQHTDPVLGLLPHEVDPAGSALDGPRGSSQALLQAFWPDVSADGRADQPAWDAFTTTFLVRRAGLVGVREFPPGRGGSGDVDSGPLIGGISASASAVTLAAARRVGDLDLATDLEREAEVLGLGLTLGGRRRYAAGLLPIGDAFLAWARSRPLAIALPTGAAPRSQWWLVLLMTALPALLMLPLYWRARQSRRHDARAATTP